MAKQVFSGFADPGLFEELQRRGSFTNDRLRTAVGGVPANGGVPMPMALPKQTVVQAGLGQLQAMGQAMPPMVPVGAPEPQWPARMPTANGGAASGGPTNVPMARRDFFDSDGVQRAVYRSDPRMSLDSAQVGGPRPIEVNAHGVPLGGTMAQVPLANSRDPRREAFVFRPDGPQAPLPQVVNQAQQQADMRGAALASVPGRMLANSGVIGPTAGDMMREQALAGSRQARWSMTGGPSQARNALEALEQSQERDRQAARQVQVAQGTPQVVAGQSGVGAWVPGQGGQPGRLQVEGTMPADVRPGPDMAQQVKDLAQAYKAMSGKDIDPAAIMSLGYITDPNEKKRVLDQLTAGGNPEAAAALSARLMQIVGQMGGNGGAASGGPTSKQAAGGAGVSKWARK